jgi:hypothetical protein
MNDPHPECHSVFQIMEGLICVFASLCLSLSLFLVVNATKILGFLTQGERLSPYIISKTYIRLMTSPSNHKGV